MWAAVISIFAAAAALSGPQRAHDDAASLLARLALPPGAQAYAGTDGPTGPAYYPASPNLADVSRTWVVPGSRDGVLAWVAQHPPAGSTLRVRGTGASNGVAFEGFEWPATPEESGRQVIVEAVQRQDGTSAVRADGQSIWVVPRPAGERVPAGMRVLRVTVTRFGRPVRPPLVIRDLRTVRRAASLIDGLPLFQPGTRACPDDPGWRVSLAFRRTLRAAVSALAVANPGGCQDVEFDIHGRHEPTLAASPALFAALAKTLGVTLIPPDPPPPAP